MFQKVFMSAMALAIMVILSSSAASAAPIVGEINIGASPGGGVQATGGTAWGTATGLDFVAAPGGPYAGFEGVVTTTVGDFTAYDYLGVNMYDFMFNPFPVSGITPLWTLAGGSFDLTALTTVLQSATGIVISGTGTFNFVGYDPTPGVWEFTSQTAGGQGPKFSFSSTQVADPVPEPASIALLGMGLLGAGLARRRQRVS